MGHQRGLLVAAYILATAAASQAADPAEAWRELFALTAGASAPASAPSEAAVRAKTEALLTAVGSDVGKLRELIASDAAYEPFEPGWRKRTVQVADGAKKYDVEYLVRIPKDYTPKKSWPVLIAAHGQFGSGEDIGAMIQLILRDKIDNYIVVAPTMPGAANFNGRLYQAQTHLLPLEWARSNLNVDDDRVYVTGYSQGGHVSWHLAVMFGHLLAASAPMAGVPAFESPSLTFDMYLENLGSVPLWAVWGEKDTAPPPAKGNVDLDRAAAARLKALGNDLFKGTELPGAGHGDCFFPRGELATFFEAHKRTAVPTKFDHFFHQPYHGRGYYLQAIAYSRQGIDPGKPIQIALPAGKAPTDDEVAKLMRDKLEKAMYRLSGELDKSKNALTITADGIRTVRVFVLDGMFDLAQPVSITINGKTWKGKVPASAKCILTNYVKTRDATCLVLNEVDVEATATAVVRYP